MRLALASGVVVLLLAALFFCTPPGPSYGDDLFYVWTIVSGRAFTNHVLYIPAGRALASFLAATAAADPWSSLRILSAVCAPLAIAGTAALVRRRGAPAIDAWLCAALLALAPSVWFYARIAEVHAPHLAAVVLALWWVAYPGRRRGVVEALGLGLVLLLLIGTHRSGVLLLPALCLATIRRRAGSWTRASGVLRSTCAIGLGLALGAAGLVAVTYLETGSFVSAADRPGTYADCFRLRLETAGALDLISHVGAECVGSAPTVLLLGIFGAGAYARAEGRGSLPVLGIGLVAVLPYLAFFAILSAAERGAYFVPLLPLALLAFARGCLASREPEAPGPSTAVCAMFALAAAGAGLATHAELTRLGGAWLILGWICAGPLGYLAHAGLSRRGWRIVAALAAACQLVGAQRNLSEYQRAFDAPRWSRDVAEAICSDDAVLITTGFSEFQALLLLRNAWPEPYSGTWSLKETCRCRGPMPVDVASLQEASPTEIRSLIDHGQAIYLDERALFTFLQHPLLGASLRRLTELFDLLPIEGGAFRGYRLIAR